MRILAAVAITLVFMPWGHASASSCTTDDVSLYDDGIISIGHETTSCDYHNVSTEKESTYVRTDDISVYIVQVDGVTVVEKGSETWDFEYGRKDSSDWLRLGPLYVGTTTTTFERDGYSCVRYSAGAGVTIYGAGHYVGFCENGGQRRIFTEGATGTVEYDFSNGLPVPSGVRAYGWPGDYHVGVEDLGTCDPHVDASVNGMGVSEDVHRCVFL